jgi:hypothetical protein
MTIKQLDKLEEKLLKVAELLTQAKKDGKTTISLKPNKK